MKKTILSIATAAAFSVSAFSADAPAFRGSLLDTLNVAWSTYDSATILSHVGLKGVQYFGKHANQEWIRRDMQNDSRTYVQNTIRVHDGTFTREVDGDTVTESVFQDQQSVERSGRRHDACFQLTIVYDAASQQLISTSIKVVPHGSWQVAKASSAVMTSDSDSAPKSETVPATPAVAATPEATPASSPANKSGHSGEDTWDNPEFANLTKPQTEAEKAAEEAAGVRFAAPTIEPQSILCDSLETCHEVTKLSVHRDVNGLQELRDQGRVVVTFPDVWTKCKVLDDRDWSYARVRTEKGLVVWVARGSIRNFNGTTNEQSPSR
jgi:hypothetical protein